MRDRELLATIAAEGFYDDPVLSWVFADPTTRFDQLRLVFGGLVDDMIPVGGVVHVVEDACVAFWRDPAYHHGRTAADRVNESSPAPTESSPRPFADDERARLAVLGEKMMANHPHEPHWYLNVLSTLTARRGQGLGARVLYPVLAQCDAEEMPAYLESSNPRNMTLYRRHGFVETKEIRLPDGPSLFAMWRDPIS